MQIIPSQEYVDILKRELRFVKWRHHATTRVVPEITASARATLILTVLHLHMEFNIYYITGG